MNEKTLGEKIFSLRESSKEAVICGDEVVTYKELWYDGVRIAKGLKNSGVKKKDIVAIDTGRCADYIRVMVGVALAGAVGVTIDRTADKNLTERIKADCSPVLIINEEHANALKSTALSGDVLSDVGFLSDVRGEDPLWIVYSSGSTGEPKGAVICHRTVLVSCNSCAFNKRNNYLYENCERLLIDAAFSFIAANYFIFYALCNGKCAVLATEEETHSLTNLANCILKNHVDYICRPQSWIVKAIENPDYEKAIKGIRMFTLGGEKNTEEAVNILKEHVPDAAIFLGYGCSELLHVSDILWQPGKSEILGTPIKDVEIYLLDEEGRPVETGNTGEICVGGETAALAHYHNASKLNKEKYEEHPVYGRICHTGDLGLRLGDGRIKIIGRKDNMIKIHGVRIEPEYIENVIRGFTGIKDTVVVAADGIKGKVLIAYYTCDGNNSSVIDEAALRGYLLTTLPYYMIPIYFVHLDQMPLNASGKLDRKKLAGEPAPKWKDNVFNAQGDHSEITDMICDVFREALHLENTKFIGKNDSFFDLGGDSISGMEAVYLMERRGYSFELKWLYTAPTPAQLAQFVVPITGSKEDSNQKINDKAHTNNKEDADISLAELSPGIKVENIRPVTYSMEKMLDKGLAWMMCVPFSVELSISGDEWKNCIKMISRTHEILRSVFVKQDEHFIRAVLKEHEPESFYVDLSGQADDTLLLSEKQKHYFDNVIGLLFNKEPDAFREVLFKAGLVRVSAERSIMLFYVSHLLIDEVGAVNLARDILTYCKENKANTPDDEGFEEHVEHVFNDDRKEAMCYWVSVCPDRRDIVALPMAPERKDVPSVRLAISGSTTMRDRVVDYCRERGISFAAFIHTLIGRALASISGKNTVGFLSVCAGRKRKEIRLAGLFAQSVPFKYSPGDGYHEIQEQLLNANNYAWLMEVPEIYDGISDKFSDGVLLDIRDDYHERGAEGYEVLQPEQLFSSPESVNKYYSKVAPPPHGRLRIYANKNWPWLYSIDFYTGEVAPDFVSHLQDKIKQELELMLEASGDKDISIKEDVSFKPFNGTVRDILLGCVAKRRDKALFLFPDEEGLHEISASEFKRRVWALGTRLSEKGISNSRIALIGRNSMEWILFAYTILCGDNTAVMIDPDSGTDEILERIRQVGAKILVGEDELVSKFSGAVEILKFSELETYIARGEQLLSENDELFESKAPTPEREAVILFTTGTTGASKAVALTHNNLFISTDGMFRSLLNHKEDMTMMITLPLYHIGAFSGMLLLYTYFAARIVVVREYRQIISAVMRTKPGYATLVPRLADVILTWLRMQKDKAGEVKHSFVEIALVGTTVSPMYREAFAEFGINILDCYGMTESSGAILMHNLPINHVEIRLAGGGKSGEILVKGPSIFSGYMDDEEATNEVFEDGWFHTGDIGTLSDDGLYSVTGRLKNLIILSNGENISPEEIEEHLDRSPLIRESIVYESDDQLAADIVVETGEEEFTDIESLEKTWLSRIREEADRINKELPPYKRVSKVSLRLDPLPRNALGKVIRKETQ